MKKVLVSDSLSPEGLDILKQAPDISVDVQTKLTPEQLQGIIGQYDALVIRSATKVTDVLLDHAERLSVIGRAGVGVDNVDVHAASKRGIVVMNTPGGNTVTTGEHAIAMMVSLARKIPQATASMKAGKWEKNKFTGTELCNKILGIIGIGRVGTIVATRAQGLKMNVLAFDPFMSPETAAQIGVSLVSLDDLYQKADFITVHTPLTKETKGLVNAQAFAKMKKGVFIINCARGGIVSEKDLHQALVSGQVAGAALDVFEEEPSQNQELLSLENVICTPHLGASTDEAQVNVAIAVAEQIVAYLTTGEIQNAVNFPSVSAEVLCVIQPYLSLAEKLGRFQAQVVAGGIQEVTIEYSGEILQYNLAPITLSLLKGLLTPILDQAVNYINAPLIAKERGIKVIEAKSTEVKDYTSMIALTVKTSQDVGSTTGTIFGRRDPRIVGVNRFVLDVIPEGHMILLYNYDKPGVIGNLGTALGNRGINIARLHLSRDQVDGKALVVISTDGTLSDDIMNNLRRVPHVISARYIEM